MEAQLKAVSQDEPVLAVTREEDEEFELWMVYMSGDLGHARIEEKKRFYANPI